MKATVYLDTHFESGTVDRRIFGGFLEHLGRAVYEGVYDPGNPRSDARGFRKDVLDVLRPLGMPLVRYPGGNFVSQYDWRDGIGPRDARPARPDFAWRSIEPNQFGVDEFVDWCRELGAEPLMAVNLGTGAPKDAAELLEYCNLGRGTYWADRRAANGHPEPLAVRTWCLGNEMDGPWQAGHVPAEVYAQRAQQAAKLMKGLDPSIELVVCGSSGRFMATYMDWDRRVLEYCWNDVDYISAHRYSGNHANDSARFLAEGREIDRILEEYTGLLAYVRAACKSARQVFLSFDEWNVWYKNHEADGRWTRAPHLLEEVYNLEDALVCAQYLNSFIRHAGVVKIACLAQIVNVIAPILTRADGVLIQSIYYPFLMLSRSARGQSLVPSVECPAYELKDLGAVPWLDVAATYDAAVGTAFVSLVNRSLVETIIVDVRPADVTFERVVRSEILSGPDAKAANSWEQPGVIVPRGGDARLADGGLQVTVPPLSLAVVDLGVKGR